jgi:hypothetical protein
MIVLSSAASLANMLTAAIGIIIGSGMASMLWLAHLAQPPAAGDKGTR